MKGECKFRLSGQVTFFKDNPVGPGKPYASLTVGLKIPAVIVAGRTFNGGVVYLNIGYNDKDLKYRYFNRLLEELPNKPNIIIAGDVKIKPAKGDYPEGFNFDARWMETGLNYNGQTINDISFFGETVDSEDGGFIRTKFSYRNPKDDTWKDRVFRFILAPNKAVTHNPRDSVIVLGKVIPTDASGNKSIWIYAEHIL